jgi:hypothetical protein
MQSCVLMPKRMINMRALASPPHWQPARSTLGDDFTCVKGRVVCFKPYKKALCVGHKKQVFPATNMFVAGKIGPAPGAAVSLSSGQTSARKGPCRKLSSSFLLGFVTTANRIKYMFRCFAFCKSGGLYSSQ